MYETTVSEDIIIATKVSTLLPVGLSTIMYGMLLQTLYWPLLGRQKLFHLFLPIRKSFLTLAV